MPAGYASHTGYQYDSISRVAGQRELAPPSYPSKLGGFRNSVFITFDTPAPPRLGKQPAQFTSELPQLQLCALALEVGLIEFVPRAAFFDDRPLKVETVGTSFLHTNVRDAHVFLRDGQLKLLDREIGRRLTRRLQRAADVELDPILLLPDGGVGFDELAARERHRGSGRRREKRNPC